MSRSLRYTTAASGFDVLQGLYAEDDPFPYVVCKVTPAEASEEPGEIDTLYVLRVDTPHSFLLANEDRVYSTKASLTPGGELFRVDVIIRSRELRTKPATISVSPDAIDIVLGKKFADGVEKAFKNGSGPGDFTEPSRDADLA